MLREIIRKISKIDREISYGIRIRNQERMPFRVAAFFAHSGDSWFWCGILMILWLFSNGEKEKTLAYWGGTIALTAAFVFLLKRVIARTRPEGEWGTVYRKTDPYSFPSGHAVRAGLIIMLTFRSFEDPLIRIIFCIWAVLMMLARVATGVHYLFDILAGFLLGLGIGWIWILLQSIIYTTFSILFDKSAWFQ